MMCLASLVGIAGAGAPVHAVPWVFDDRTWSHAQDLDVGEDPSNMFFVRSFIADGSED